jgi:septal ring factor EnvC (AmiA/AmiB activator)
MWTILAFVALAIAFCWLAYQLWQGGKSNATLQVELKDTRDALAETNRKLAETNRKNQELQSKLAETNGKLDTCTKALNEQ